MRLSVCALLMSVSIQQSAVNAFHSTSFRRIPSHVNFILSTLSSNVDPPKIILPSSSSSSLLSSSSPPSIRRLSWCLRASKEEEEEDLLDYFDPLLSPHAYPDGIDSKKTSGKSSSIGTRVDEQPPSSSTNNDDNWTPLKMKNVKDDFRGASERDYQTQKSYFTGDWASSPNSPTPISPPIKPDITQPTTTNDDSSLFDPLLSPHAYPKGTSSGPVLQKKTSTTPPPRIGVLLIDHGSRRPSSNAHLLKVAELYQSRAPANVVVRAAHMEILPPSIADGIGELWREDKVDKIICHPYFLSPGRHVAEDVPELIYGAVVEMNGGTVEEGVVWDGEEGLFLGDGGEVEVIMTEPVGSKIDRMVDIIGDMVEGCVGEENLEVAGNVADNGENKAMGGFFGNVQRMMDEQL